MTGHVHVGNVMVDGLGVGDVGNIVLRDETASSRRRYHHCCSDLRSRFRTGTCRPGYRIKGFVYVRGSESLMDEAKQVLDVDNAADDG